MSVQIRGFEGLTNELDQLRERAESADGANTVSISELFPADFMQTHTDCDSISQFFGHSPWTIEGESDFERIPEDEFDSYVDEHSGFSSWDAMLSAAAREWVTRQVDP
jgi:hypothetical protein